MMLTKNPVLDDFKLLLKTVFGITSLVLFLCERVKFKALDQRLRRTVATSAPYDGRTGTGEHIVTRSGLSTELVVPSLSFHLLLRFNLSDYFFVVVFVFGVVTTNT